MTGPFVSHPVLSWGVAGVAWLLALVLAGVQLLRGTRRGRWMTPAELLAGPSSVSVEVPAQRVSSPEPARRATAAELAACPIPASRVTPLDPRRPCRCGCPAEVHDHLRDGDDCGYCGRAICRSYRPDPRAIPRVVTPATVGTPEGDVESTFALWPARADVNDLDLIARLTRENVRPISRN